jgi:HD superfamily phosphohydrolase
MGLQQGICTKISIECYNKPMQNNRIVNDTVYGHIPYSGIEEKFLQSKIVNRLLFVSQNALAYFAFPSITTKRYIHSLGTMHVVSHMFKNSLINASSKNRSKFLKQARKSIKKIIKTEQLTLDLDSLVIKDKMLLGFSVAFSEKENSTYLLLLQALRLVGLLHDVGHLPFSHQTEYALTRLYLSVSKIKKPNIEQKKFLKFYNTITNQGEMVLHESIGYEYLDMVFNHEVSEQSNSTKELIKLYYLLVKNIFDDVITKEFSYVTLHQYISSTVDADRIDYINRDLLASGYISTSSDFLRVTKEAIVIEENKQFELSFLSSSLYDIEHLLESRFNLYKKVFFTHHISRLDTLLERVITFLAKKYLSVSPKDKKVYETIAMMWKFTAEKSPEKQLDTISQLDENWLISLFKKEYFKIKYQLSLTYQERYYLSAFEDILFGKHFFKANWKNLSEFYNILNLSTEERFIFREKFGFISIEKRHQLEQSLEELIEKYAKENNFYTYSIVSMSIGIDTNFRLYDGEKTLLIDEVSTLRKRLKTSMSNSVPFFIFSNQTSLDKGIIKGLRKILFEVF